MLANSINSLFLRKAGQPAICQFHFPPVRLVLIVAQRQEFGRSEGQLTLVFKKINQTKVKSGTQRGARGEAIWRRAVGSWERIKAAAAIDGGGWRLSRPSGRRLCDAKFAEI
jgi:hypothetical protein